ncbi:bidirectional sugar transporter N3 [Artemisia annua]|uniref:Bidirectional sugar transporter SWEET n=1 Tax=Artemisia annua TaxID=35608 RepID=A0A2U1LSW2_ARTAN|nr:bidirectional sugar transporter N3 [Artemisia annua]
MRESFSSLLNLWVHSLNQSTLPLYICVLHQMKRKHSISMQIFASTLSQEFPVSIYIETHSFIYKQKSTTELRSLPYVATLFSLLLWIYYGLICEGDERILLITVKLVGSFIESVNITIIYLRATPDEKKKTKKIICLMMVGHVVASFVTFILSHGWRRADIVGLICARVSLCLLTEELTIVRATPDEKASFVTFILSHGWRRVDIVGLICAGVSLCLLTEELTIVVQVVKTESSEFISFTTPLRLTLSSMMWFLYGLFMVYISVMV